MNLSLLERKFELLGLLPGLVEISPLTLKKKTFYFNHILLLFRYYLPLQKSVTLHLNKRDCTSLKKFGYYCPCGFEKDF